MGNVQFQGKVYGPEGNLLISSQLGPTPSNLGPSEVFSNDFDFIVRQCNGAMTEATRHSLNSRPPQYSYFRQVALGNDDDVSFTACFDFRGQYYPDFDAFFSTVEDIAIPDDNGGEHIEYCLKECYRDVRENKEDANAVTVPDIHLVTEIPSPKTVRIVSHHLIQHFPRAITANANCKSGSMLELDNTEYSDDEDTSQLFFLHPNGSIESVKCPGLYLDVAGNNCDNDIILWDDLHGNDNQVWIVQESSSTVNSYGPVHTISSKTCPDKNLILSDNLLVLGSGWVIDQWHLYEV